MGPSKCSMRETLDVASLAHGLVSIGPPKRRKEKENSGPMKPIGKETLSNEKTNRCLAGIGHGSKGVNQRGQPHPRWDHSFTRQGYVLLSAAFTSVPGYVPLPAAFTSVPGYVLPRLAFTSSAILGMGIHPDG